MNIETLCDKYDNGNKEERFKLVKQARYLLPWDYYIFLNHCLNYHKYKSKLLATKLNSL
jgi:hypothetical protein